MSDRIKLTGDCVCGHPNSRHTDGLGCTYVANTPDADKTPCPCTLTGYAGREELLETITPGPELVQHTPADFEQAIAAAERRGFQAAAARTIEPVAEPAPPGIPVALSQASHAGLALTTGDLLQRVARIEEILQGMGISLEPQADTTLMVKEPEPQGPVDDEG